MRNLVFCMLFCASFAQAQHTTNTMVTSPPVIGDEFITNHQTTHPYNPSGQTGIIFEQEFYNKNSAYIKLYFENFDLGPEDYIEITTHNTGESIIYAGKGKIIDREGTMMSNFWSQALLDDRITVSLHSSAPSDHYGFKISKVAYGYSAEKIDAIVNGKSICGTDDKERVACYSGTTMFTRSRAVCKLIIGGVGSCTGWLLGCEGHIMTNNHCIQNATQAANTDFLFDFQHSSCTGSASLTANTVATSSTFIKTSSRLDYTLVKLPTNPTNQYGYLSLSSAPPSVGDRIYIPQHPRGRRKEISVKTDQGGTAGGFSMVNSLTTNGMRYYADTERGSSGSPVLSYASNLVYSIHNTGGCTNGSSGRCDKLIPNIGSSMPKGGVNYNGCQIGNPCRTSISNFPYTESFERGLGSWTNASGDNFDWTRRTGSTPSTNTGPSSAAHRSYYIYTESSNPNFGGKRAIFNSPCFDLRQVFAPRLSFRYHMYGSTMGNLYLQASTNGTNWTTIWTKSGDQGNNWKTASVNLSSYTNASQLRLRFVGVTGRSFRSDMAIDYVRITSSVVSTICNNAFPLSNSFELGWDSWTNNASGDNFNWTRKTGSTPSTNTGPSSAANGSYYIYTESSKPNFGGKTAIVTSRCQNMNRLSNPTVAFSYHMYGSTMGTLRLQVSVNNGPWTTIWTKSGNQGNNWKNQYINVNAYKSGNTRFRFFGTTGPSFRSDMAVDNFRLINGIINRPLDPNIESAPLSDVVADPYVHVFPNPFDDQINIETNIEGLSSYRVTNLQGQVIQEASLQTNQIMLSDLVPGVYFIMLYNDEEQHVRKIVKQ